MNPLEKIDPNYLTVLERDSIEDLVWLEAQAREYFKLIPPEAYLESLATAKNCEGKGMRMRLDAK